MATPGSPTQSPVATTARSIRSRTATPPELPPSTTPPSPADWDSTASLSVAIDGNNRLFLNSAAANTIVEFDPALGTTGGNSGSFLLTSAGNGFNPSSNTAALASSIQMRTTTIDASGALWMVNGAGSNPVVQILGIAAPTVPVLAQGKYGVKP